MNCTASDEINLVNVSLILDGVVNETLIGAGSSLAFGTDCKSVVFGIFMGSSFLPHIVKMVFVAHYFSLLNS